MTALLVSDSPPHAMDKMIRDSVSAITGSERRENNVRSLLGSGITILVQVRRVSVNGWELIRLFGVWLTKSRAIEKTTRHRLLGMKRCVPAREQTF